MSAIGQFHVTTFMQGVEVDYANKYVWNFAQSQKVLPRELVLYKQIQINWKLENDS